MKQNVLFTISFTSSYYQHRCTSDTCVIRRFLLFAKSHQKEKKEEREQQQWLFLNTEPSLPGWWWCRHSVWPWFTTVLLLLLVEKRCELSFFHSISFTHAKLQRWSQRYVCTSKSASRSYPSCGIYWCTGVGATSVDISALDRWHYNSNWMKFEPIVERAARIYCRQKCIDWLFSLSLSPRHPPSVACHFQISVEACTAMRVHWTTGRRWLVNEGDQCQDQFRKVSTVFRILSFPIPYTFGYQNCHHAIINMTWSSSNVYRLPNSFNVEIHCMRECL